MRNLIHISAISTLANRRLAFAVLVTIIVALVIDTSVIRIYNVNFKQLPLEVRTIVLPFPVSVWLDSTLYLNSPSNRPES